MGRAVLADRRDRRRHRRGRPRAGLGAWSLPDHVESGGERFSIEWDEFSRPRHPLARLGYPLTRRLQQRFARDSMAAMRRASQ